jgi:hypothetical protein
MSTQIVVHITYGCGGVVVPLDLCLIDDKEVDALAFRPLEQAEMRALSDVLEGLPRDDMVVILGFAPGQKPVELTSRDIAEMTGCIYLSGARIIHQKIAAKAARLTTNCMQKLHDLAEIQGVKVPGNGAVNTIFAVSKEGKSYSLMDVHHEDSRDFSCGIVCVRESDSDKHHFRMITPHTTIFNRTCSAPIVEKNVCEFLAQCPVIWQAVLVEASRDSGGPIQESCVVVRVGDPAHLQKLKHLGGVHGHTSFLAMINMPLPYKQITGIHIGRNGDTETTLVLDKSSPVRSSLSVQEFLHATQKVTGFLGASPEECKLLLFHVE